MAFTIANWACISGSLNQGQETVTPFLGSPTVLNAPNFFTYGSPNDAVAAIVTANYFLPEYASLSVGDIIIGFGTDAAFSVQVTAVSSTSVTVASMGLTTTIGTANLVNGAVTSAKLAPSLLQLATVTVTSTQFDGMYAAPVQLLAAPGAGLMNVVDSILLNLAYGSAQFAGGGVVGAQYGNTVHGAGPAASATEAAADFNAVSANTMFRIGGGLSTGVATSAAINTPIYLSNATAAFTGGTGGSFTVDVWYKTVAAV